MNNILNKQQIANLVQTLGKIKDLRRSGWIKRQVSSLESDADHMYSLAIEILLLAPPHLDRCHCLELALTHDLQEIYATDILPGQMEPQQKYQIELASARRLADELNFPQLTDWFTEFENQSTPESRFVKCLDKMDNVVTAAYYEREGRSNQPLMEEFSGHALRQITALTCPDKEICLQIINFLREENKQKTE